MSETSTTAGTWAPDGEKLARAAYHNHFDFPEWPDVTGIEEALWHQTAQAVIAEYQRQAAAAGLVMVEQELLDAAHDWFQGEIGGFAGYMRERKRARLIGEIRDDVLHRRRDDLAATPEPAPGGDV